MKIPTLPSLVGLACFSASPSLAFIGHGIQMFNPTCAFACRGAISSAMLSCSDPSKHTEGHSHGASAMTTPECRAGDTSFLTTLSWCINSTCAGFDVEIWRLEKYWNDKTTGEPAVVPKWGYGEALDQVAEPPSQQLGEEDTLNFTAIVPYDTWYSQKQTYEKFELAETLHSRYGYTALDPNLEVKEGADYPARIAILVTGFGTPIVFTLLGYLPYMTGLFDKIKPYLTYPSLIGTYQVRPLPYLLGNAPTVGQSLYIALILGLNVVLAAVGYSTSYPNNAWFESTSQEVMAYLANRTGVLAFALAPLVILFSGRNNVLLWLTDWSHSTYMLLHRWVARVFALQVIIHSLVELALYKDKGDYETELKEEYWIWGAVATVATCIILIASHLYVRRWSYEVFLIVHVVLAVFILVGSWFHVEILFSRKWGYQFWLYAAGAIWISDRLIRVLRIGKVGVRHARVIEIGSQFVRVDVEGVRWGRTAGYHAYAYFPTLSPLKPWENHPFSVIPTTMLPSLSHSVARTESQSSEDYDAEKSNGATTMMAHPQRMTTNAGVSLYIRKSKGITKFLKTQGRLITLLDGPYRSTPSSAMLKCDKLLLIGGGIGITSLLPWIHSHSNVKLCWSVKQDAECLVHDLELALKGVSEKEVKIGQRLAINTILADEEHVGWRKIGVIVCGPGGLCDDVRAAVAKAGRQGSTTFELEVDAYSW